jgi:hypothetical protein
MTDSSGRIQFSDVPCEDATQVSFAEADADIEAFERDMRGVGLFHLATAEGVLAALVGLAPSPVGWFAKAEIAGQRVIDSVDFSLYRVDSSGVIHLDASHPAETVAPRMVKSRTQCDGETSQTRLFQSVQHESVNAGEMVGVVMEIAGVRLSPPPFSPPSIVWLSSSDSRQESENR